MTEKKFGTREIENIIVKNTTTDEVYMEIDENNFSAHTALDETVGIDYERECAQLEKEVLKLKEKLKKAQIDIEKMRIAMVNLLIKLGQD